MPSKKLGQGRPSLRAQPCVTFSAATMLPKPVIIIPISTQRRPRQNNVPTKYFFQLLFWILLLFELNIKLRCTIAYVYTNPWFLGGVAI